MIFKIFSGNRLIKINVLEKQCKCKMIFVITIVKKSLAILFYEFTKLPTIQLSNRHVLLSSTNQSSRSGQGCNKYYCGYKIQEKKKKEQEKKASKKLGNNKDGVKK